MINIVSKKSCNYNLIFFAKVPDVDAVVIPVGGGGLLAGIAKAMKTMKPSVKIIVSGRRG